MGMGVHRAANRHGIVAERAFGFQIASGIWVLCNIKQNIVWYHVHMCTSLVRSDSAPQDSLNAFGNGSSKDIVELPLYVL